MKRYVYLVAFFILALAITACTGNCHYWRMKSVTNPPSNSYFMDVCDWRLDPQYDSYFRSDQLPDARAIQLANDLLHSKAEFKACNINDQQRVFRYSGSFLSFLVTCNGGGPAIKGEYRWSEQYRFDD
jgi:hypothetical protein